MMRKVLTTLALAAAAVMTDAAGELPVVTYITLDDGGVYSDNYGETASYLRLSWLADWEPADTTAAARYFQFVPVFYNPDGTVMAVAATKESKLTPYVQRDLAYGGDIVSGKLVPGPARLAIGYFVDDTTFVSYGDKEIEVTDGRPGFTLTPVINTGDEGIDPTDFNIDLDVTCNRGNSGPWYSGGIWCYIYADEACKSGTSVWKKKINLNMTAGDTRTLTYIVSLPQPMYDHTYYYKYGFVDINDVIRMYSTKHSFTTMADGAVDAIIADDTDAPAEYYKLQGVRIAHPVAGTVCIKRQGHTSKLVISK